MGRPPSHGVGGQSVPVRTVILDRDGTLYNEYKGVLQAGVPEMLERLKGLGLNVFIVSNEEREKGVETLLGVSRDQCLYNADCGVKGSKKYVRKVIELTGDKLNEVVYLGDSDLDMREAAGGHERLALFNAEWSNPNYMYGLPMNTPADFVDVLETYFLKEHLWFFRVDGDDSLNRPVMFRALLDPDTCKTEGITDLLKQRKPVLSNREQELANHLVLHLLASLYLEGLHLIREPNNQGGFKKPLYTIYPGCTGDISPVLRLFERFTARLLTMKYEETLVSRHTPAPSSHKQRMGGGSPEVAVQFNTIQVSPAFASKVKGNVVLVADDFSTGSNAMETSRNLLMTVGAKRVIGITVGKYRRDYTAFSPDASCKLPTGGGPANITGTSLARKTMPVVQDDAAKGEF